MCVCDPQASYLVGVSDPNSQAGHQGLVDPIQFAKANQAIQMACQNLVDPDSSPSQVQAPAMVFLSFSDMCITAGFSVGNTVRRVFKYFCRNMMKYD